MIERVLIVGLGSIGRRHARIARRLLPEAEIAALRRTSLVGDAEPAVQRLFVTSIDALAYRPDIVVIANPATHHVASALPFARQGTHLFVEKPIAASARGVAGLIAVCRSRGSVLMTGYNLRFVPSMTSFKDAIDSGRVGRILSIRSEVGQYLPSWRPGADYRKTVSARAALGGGVLLELSHEIDYVRWLFGEVVWVCGVCSKQSDLETDVEDTAHLVMGIRGKAGQSVIPATLTMDFVRRDTTRRCTVVGHDGTLCWDGVEGTVSLVDQAGRSSVLSTHKPQRDESYVAEWAHLIDCIRNRLPPSSTGEEALQVLNIVEAARRSSRRRRSVFVRGASRL